MGNSFAEFLELCFMTVYEPSMINSRDILFAETSTVTLSYSIFFLKALGWSSMEIGSDSVLEFRALIICL